MFGIGMPELFVIMALALIVIGPKKLPDLARSIGRALGEFKKATGELKSSLGVDEELSNVKHAFDDINQEIKEAINVDPLSPPENTPAETDDPADSETTVDPIKSETKSAETKQNAADMDSTVDDDLKKKPGETAGDK